MKYLVTIHHPDDYDASVVEDETMSRDIDALNGAMEAAGVRIFVGGLRPPSSAKSLRRQPDGEVLITDGPYLGTTEHVAGFRVLEAADVDEALAWGRKAFVACRSRSKCASSTDVGAVFTVMTGIAWLKEHGSLAGRLFAS